MQDMPTSCASSWTGQPAGRGTRDALEVPVVNGRPPSIEDVPKRSTVVQSLS